MINSLYREPSRCLFALLTAKKSVARTSSFSRSILWARPARAARRRRVGRDDSGLDHDHWARSDPASKERSRYCPQRTKRYRPNYREGRNHERVFRDDPLFPIEILYDLGDAAHLRSIPRHHDPGIFTQVPDPVRAPSVSRNHHNLAVAPAARKEGLPRQARAPADGRQYHPSRSAQVVASRESNPSGVQSAHRPRYEVQFRCEWFRAIRFARHHSPGCIRMTHYLYWVEIQRPRLERGRRIRQGFSDSCDFFEHAARAERRLCSRRCRRGAHRWQESLLNETTYPTEGC